MTTRPLLAVAAATSLLLTGCGASVTASPGQAASPTTAVHRCGQLVNYQDPQRVVVYEGGSADKMFALGLGDKVLGYVMPPANPDVTSSPYAADYAKTRLLSTDLLNKELVVKEKADMVIAGWNSGFSEKRGITPEILDGLGIASFMHTETCFKYPGHPEQARPLEGLYKDLERLGQIFHVEDRAATKVAEFRSRIEKVKAAARTDRPRPKVFFYDSGTDQPSSAGNQVPVQEIIDVAGGTNIYAGLPQRWTTTSWESVVKANPDVIMIMSYKDKPADQKIAFLKQHPSLSQVPAVKNDAFFVIDYNESISGPRVIDGAEKFGQWLRTR